MTKAKSDKTSSPRPLSQRVMTGEEAIQEALRLLGEPTVSLTRNGQDVKAEVVGLLEAALEEVNLTKRIDPIRRIERLGPNVEGTHPEVPRILKMVRGGVSAVMTGIAKAV